jgi:fructose-specific phosphotransferase system component IIB
VSEALDQDESVIEDIVEFYYSELRKTLSNLTHPRIDVEGLGHFVAKTGLVRKSIPKYTNILKNHDTSTYGAYFNKKMLETKLELLIQLEHKILLQEIKKDEFKKMKEEYVSQNNSNNKI